MNLSESAYEMISVAIGPVARSYCKIDRAYQPQDFIDDVITIFLQDEKNIDSYETNSYIIDNIGLFANRARQLFAEKVRSLKIKRQIKPERKILYVDTQELALLKNSYRRYKEKRCDILKTMKTSKAESVKSRNRMSEPVL